MPRTLDQCVDIAAPAERVWDLLSTSEGLSCWFVDATVAPGPQGSVTLRFAPGAEATVPVLAWDPSRQVRFGVPGDRVHDITITTAAGWAGYLGRLRALAEAGR